MDSNELKKLDKIDLTNKSIEEVANIYNELGKYYNKLDKVNNENDKINYGEEKND